MVHTVYYSATRPRTDTHVHSHSHGFVELCMCVAKGNGGRWREFLLIPFFLPRFALFSCSSPKNKGMAGGRGSAYRKSINFAWALLEKWKPVLVRALCTVKHASDHVIGYDVTPRDTMTWCNAVATEGLECKWGVNVCLWETLEHKNPDCTNAWSCQYLLCCRGITVTVSGHGNKRNG